MTRVLSLAAAASLGCLLVACAAPDRQASPTSSAPPASTTATSAPPSPSPTPTGPPRVTLSFAGDVHFEGRLQPLRADPATALLPIAPQLSAADVTVLNLEAAITERGVPEPKQFHFRVPEEMLAAFPAAGVDVLTMANNHGVDYGRDGLEDTLAAIGRSPIPVVGIGADAEQAFTPAVVDVRGTQVAVIGADQHPDRTTRAWTADDDSPGVASALEPERLLAAVTAARAAADVVVVYLHWGTDYEACPNDRQRTLTEQLALAGADVVVGAHAHELQGAGWFPVDRAAEGIEGPGSVYVSYGLGNFVWWRSNSEVAITTGVLTLTLEGRTTVDARWTPMRIADTGLPVVQTGDDALAGLAYWDQVRECSDLSASAIP